MWKACNSKHAFLLLFIKKVRILYTTWVTVLVIWLVRNLGLGILHS